MQFLEFRGIFSGKKSFGVNSVPQRRRRAIAAVIIALLVIAVVSHGNPH